MSSCILYKSLIYENDLYTNRFAKRDHYQPNRRHGLLFRKLFILLTSNRKQQQNLLAYVAS
jgi:hypothetical protein